MKSKEPVSAATTASTSLPVLMRPAQLPWRDTAILNALLVLDADGIGVRYSAIRCRVDVIARDVVIISGFTDRPEFVEVFCMYAEGGN
jgi:hypothetical protein